LHGNLETEMKEKIVLVLRIAWMQTRQRVVGGIVSGVAA